MVVIIRVLHLVNPLYLAIPSLCYFAAKGHTTPLLSPSPTRTDLPLHNLAFSFPWLAFTLPVSSASLFHIAATDANTQLPYTSSSSPQPRPPCLLPYLCSSFLT